MVARQGYKLTEVGEVPEDWEVYTYGELFQFLPTASYSRAQTDSESATRYVHYGDIHVKFSEIIDIDRVDLPRVSNSRIKNYSLLKSGDLIMADASEDYERYR